MTDTGDQGEGSLRAAPRPAVREGGYRDALEGLQRDIIAFRERVITAEVQWGAALVRLDKARQAQADAEARAVLWREAFTVAVMAGVLGMLALWGYYAGV